MPHTHTHERTLQALHDGCDYYDLYGAQIRKGVCAYALVFILRSRELGISIVDAKRCMSNICEVCGTYIRRPMRVTHKPPHTHCTGCSRVCMLVMPHSVHIITPIKHAACVHHMRALAHTTCSSSQSATQARVRTHQKHVNPPARPACAPASLCLASYLCCMHIQ